MLMTARADAHVLLLFECLMRRQMMLFSVIDV